MMTICLLGPTSADSAQPPSNISHWTQAYITELFQSPTWPSASRRNLDQGFQELAANSPHLLQQAGQVYLKSLLGWTLRNVSVTRAIRIFDHLDRFGLVEFYYDPSIRVPGTYLYNVGVRIAEYDCHKNKIRLNLAVAPIDLLGSYVHELSHVLWNFSKHAQALPTAASVLEDELMAIIASAYTQYTLSRVVESFSPKTGPQRVQPQFKAANGADFNLFDSDGFVALTYLRVQKFPGRVDYKNPLTQLMQFGDLDSWLELTRNVAHSLFQEMPTDDFLKWVWKDMLRHHLRLDETLNKPLDEPSILFLFDRWMFGNSQNIWKNQIPLNQHPSFPTNYCAASAHYLSNQKVHQHSNATLIAKMEIKKSQSKKSPEEVPQRSDENKGNGAGVKGNDPGNKGNGAGVKGNDPGNKGNGAGVKGNDPGNKGNGAGVKGNDPGNKGNAAGVKGLDLGNKGLNLINGP